LDETLHYTDNITLLNSKVGVSEMLKTARYQLPATEWLEKTLSFEDLNFLAVLKWMWHLALEAGKVFQTASM
jgi:hypothetical protein